MTDKMREPYPKAGQIIGCWFPELQNNPNKPGSKFRPCVICGSESEIGVDHPFLLVAYGTGQHTSDKPREDGKPQPFMFELNPVEDRVQLTEQTRFDMSTVVRLPYTPEWFGSGQNSNGFSKIYGTVPKARMEEARKARAAGSAKRGKT